MMLTRIRPTDSRPEGIYTAIRHFLFLFSIFPPLTVSASGGFLERSA
ncbi:hypothetical protein A464_442 [Salmonella bongori N268-08]|uniref:Uncharacterized protein n=1 Tax=Salmonella bongori N268-08 TaxID=1197719 RepID=S5MSS1_SALBN|nr:hypothetical protein A464_442 [Salmonella bongori N268-08]